MKVEAFVVLLLPLAHGLLQYQDRVPNGFRVPHPCFESEIWMGVGHQNREGGGVLNPFGRDFKDNEFEWDWCLCQHDSDGDGNSNGEELGDPDCVWVIGGIPDHISGLSHPGICEPLDDPICEGKNDFVKEICSPVDFVCPAVDEPDSEDFLAAFTEVTIDPIETSYWCYAVEIPHNETYHMFAMEPHITNPKVVHHIEVYDCPGSLGDDALELYPTPMKCGAMGSCGAGILTQWSLGIGSVCLGETHGVKMTSKVAMIRIHYHNPEELENEKDSSGILLHYTPVIREFDVQIMSFMGQYLEIPPQLPSVKWDVNVENCLTGEHGLVEDIKVIMATTHMHFLGKSSRSEIWRNGEFVEVLFQQDNYDYNAPLFISYEDDPIIIKPGDTIRHVCEFQSMDRTNVTYRGQSGNDEMCESVIIYYPAHPTLTGSRNWGEVERCSHRGINTIEYLPEFCDYDDFIANYDIWMEAMLQASCDVTGKECLDHCEEAVANVTNSHPCFHDITVSYLKKRNDELRDMLNSCRVWPTAPPLETPAPPGGDCRFTDGSTTLMLNFMGLFLGLMSNYFLN